MSDLGILVIFSNARSIPLAMKDVKSSKGMTAIKSIGNHEAKYLFRMRRMSVTSSPLRVMYEQ